jgi:hypothetical protein
MNGLKMLPMLQMTEDKEALLSLQLAQSTLPPISLSLTAVVDTDAAR